MTTLTKTCSKCGCTKPLDAFYKQATGALGVLSRCKECKKQENHDWNTRNREKTRLAGKTWALKNPEKRAQALKAWKIFHKQHVKNYARTNNAQRRAAKMLRVSAWADPIRIKAYYDVCAFFNEVNGYTKYHVDHVIPLQGKTVSGLHVHNNLQIIPASENISKGNRYGN